MISLPSEWRLHRLSELGFAYSGLSGKTKEDFGIGSNYVPYKNVFFNTFVDLTYVEQVNVSPDEAQNKVQKGDVLLTTSSETPEEVGMSSVVTDDVTSDLYLNSFCFGFRPTCEGLLPRYLGYAFRSSYMRKKLVFLAQGSTRFNLSRARVLEIELAIPPIAEQQKIAAILTAADSKLDLISRQIEATNSLKQGLLQTLFSHGAGTRGTGGKWLPHKEFKRFSSQSVPAAWLSRRLGDIAPLIRRPVEIDPGKSYPELGLRSYGKGTFHKPALLGAEVGNKRLFQIKAGDLLFSNVFAWEGAVAVARPEDDGRYGSHRYITCAVDTSQADTSFLFRYLTTPAGIASLKLASPGGAGRNKTLGLGALADITVPLPPLDEQRKITQILDGVEAKLCVLESKRTACEALKRGLMQKLLTGEWRVRLDSSGT